jgi:hypothetical protein
MNCLPWELKVIAAVDCKGQARFFNSGHFGQFICFTREKCSVVFCCASTL